MKVPVLSGIYASEKPDLGIAYPVNMQPIVMPNGVNEGYLRPAEGIVQFSKSEPFEGVDRGGINWDNVCYRVIGTKFCRITSSGGIVVIGDVGEGGMCSFDYGYTTLVDKDYVSYLGIVSGGRLYYYSSTGVLEQMTSADLGTPIDIVWSNGYFVLTDGTYVFNTKLQNPFEIGVGEYGTTDVDPDPIVALIKLRNEIYVLNRYTIQALQNTGTPVVGTFTWSTVDGGQMTKGCVGTHACCVFEQSIAYLGGGRNEAPGIYIGVDARVNRISTIEIDRILLSYTEAQLSQVVLESRNDSAQRLLYVHLPDKTLVFDSVATQAFQSPVWFIVLSSSTGDIPYAARGMVWCYNKWLVGDPRGTGNVGYLTSDETTHWGSAIPWEFSTPIVYNESKGVVFHELELVALTGRNRPAFVEATVATSYSLDGTNWSASKSIQIGSNGQTTKRLCWFKQGFMESMRIQRFQGNSDGHIPVLRLEARLEPLNA